MKPTKSKSIWSRGWCLMLVLTLLTLRSHAQMGVTFGLPCPCNTDSLVRYRLKVAQLDGLVDMAEALLKMKDARLDSLNQQAQRKLNAQATELLTEKVENDRLTTDNRRLTADNVQLKRDTRRFRIGATLGGLAALLALLSHL